jgi:hypothetical protein
MENKLRFLNNFEITSTVKIDRGVSEFVFFEEMNKELYSLKTELKAALLTIVEGIVTDKEQLKSTKNLVENQLYSSINRKIDKVNAAYEEYCKKKLDNTLTIKNIYK